MPRFDKWLPFFEEPSRKRDTASWWSNLEWIAQSGMKVIMTVSDRAKALLQLTTPDYLATFSMPDLFHFMQDLSKCAGCRLGLDVLHATKKLSKSATVSADYAALEQVLAQKKERLAAYKSQREGINKIVHPFDEKDVFTDARTLEIQLQRHFTRIRVLAKEGGIEIDLTKGQKVLNQIPDLASGVGHWLQYLGTQIQQLELSEEERLWLEKKVLPCAYWQTHQGKISRKRNNRQINQYYLQRSKQAKDNLDQDPLSKTIPEHRKEQLLNWAFDQVRTFHRASSQVEGRNGYLAFFHHANRAIPKNRKKVLTIVHNFDTRRADGKTPAQRLFKRDFPDLFDFVLEQIDDLPKPRKRKMKARITT